MQAHASIAAWIRDAHSVVAFTGAGISTESGIPDFRSPGGVWSKYQPVYFDDFIASEAARREYWRQKCEAHDEFAAARANAGHETLAAWEERGILRGIVTQNIDGLHQLAGNQHVLELHGTAREASCIRCGGRQPIQPLVSWFRETDQVPQCQRCSGPMKHATISFGQALPEEVLQQAELWMRGASLVLVLGSSLVVHPAAALPQIAVEQGARLVIVNRDPTPLDPLADLTIREPLGDTLLAVDAAL